MNTFKTLDLLTIPLDGMNLIEASAGTGKTFTISNVYLRLILETESDIKNILVVTFTDAATKEIKDRIRRNLNKAYVMIDSLETPSSDNETIIIQKILRKSVNDFGEQYVKLAIKKAIINFDEAAIFTIHSFCKRALDENSFESGQFFDTELISDERDIIQEITYDFWRKKFSEKNIVFGSLAKEGKLSPSKLISFAKEVLNKPLLKIIPDELPEELNGNYEQDMSLFIKNIKHQYASYLKKELYIQKKLNNIQYFDDLLMDLYQALKSDRCPQLTKMIRTSYKAALIDEFQDTDPVQYEIFNTLFNTKDHVLFLIGDPKQSIYGFRGADVFSYIEASIKTDNDNKYTLKTNWRSETNLIEGVNTLFKGENPFVLKQDIDYRDIHADPMSKGNIEPLMIEGDEPSNIVLWFLKKRNPTPKSKNPNKDEAADDSVKAVVFEISRILKLSSEGKAKIGNRPVLPSDFAILVTQHKDASRFVEPFLELNIPVVLQKTGNIFASTEAEELQRVLLAIGSPGNTRRVNAALITSFIGCNSYDINSFMEIDDGFEEYEKHIERFSYYLSLWHKEGFIQMFRKWLSEYHVRQKLLNLPDGERRLTNLLHLSELLHKAEVENRFGVTGLIYWFIDKFTYSEQNEEWELRLERDDEAIKIITVFKSKGLEYPIVFCPFMWQKGANISNEMELIFHDKGDIYLDIGSSDINKNIETASKERLSELMRILYVAITRAKNRCYLTCGKIGNPAANSIDYLFLRDGLKEENIVSSLIKKIKSCSEEDIRKAIELSIKDKPFLNLSLPCKDNPIRYAPFTEITPDKFISCKFNKRIDTIWGITSYSRLIAREKKEGSESLKNDEYQSDESNEQKIGSEVKSEGFFSFPRGRTAGSCIHSIFEQVDFSCKDILQMKNLIHAKLKNYGLCCENDLDNKKREDTVYDMINNVLHASLNSKIKDFSLSKLSKKDFLYELSFYYPIKKMTPEILKNIFSTYILPSHFNSKDFTEKIEDITFKPIEGFMQGSIDLVFQWEGKYYLLDWKTNHLGNSYEDYSYDNISKAMLEHLYVLQYLIYTVALNKYLSSRLSDYCYDKHFGGVFYLFVRGINPEISDNGIFYDLPSKEFINKFSKLCG
ncbi:MAG: UvrD-helicase domain-containing protein [Desulfobacterales bacterium]|nr:UvrD-helicase domain-containing protein [Desulfobacterales bacterium]